MDEPECELGNYQVRDPEFYAEPDPLGVPGGRADGEPGW